ncbi:hypothetical protein SPHV1_1480003 [Novosphingobium sp. KN65.2]|nr:hypothetical protein SPHV1_1480003 [Novosphingobium sp. KN65.2]
MPSNLVLCGRGRKCEAVVKPLINTQIVRRAPKVLRILAEIPDASCQIFTGHRVQEGAAAAP